MNKIDYNAALAIIRVNGAENAPVGIGHEESVSSCINMGLEQLRRINSG